MRVEVKKVRFSTYFAVLVIALSFSECVLAQDDGPRAYWKMRAGTWVVSYQQLRLNIDAQDSQAFAPGQYIYANADVEADIFMASVGRHFTLFKRPASLMFTIAGGEVDADISATATPPAFLPPNVTPTGTFSQSSSGFADPNLQLAINVYGTPPLKSTVDLLNYEPTWTVDVAAMLAFPIGEYDDDELVNLGLNRWWGRLAVPVAYHFGVFDSGHMSSIELVPSIWLFGENDDFLGQKLENDPLWQLEAHLTHDFTTSFFGSLDVLYRNGFQSEINGVDVGEDLNIGDLGFTLHYQVNDNFGIRGGYSSNVFGNSDIDNGVFRIQFMYGWNKAVENAKKLTE